MKRPLLELHFSQLKNAWGNSKNNVYSDSRKQGYHDSLSSLFEFLVKDQFVSLTSSQSFARSQIINFFLRSLKVLDGSTLNNIPFEIVKCLEVALLDFAPSQKEFIIVTSLSDNINDFYFDDYLAINDHLYQLIENTSGIQFNYRLIQINLPRYLARDYFANVVLYHEVGHFIDLIYGISDTQHDRLCILINYFIVIGSINQLKYGMTH
ncbi:MAG: hypothetical protein HC819_04080 [Cyclobacteriaceae bacterium]|nr:hypothetical protein [Cyclobacteriaceae bacterium]